MKEAYKILYEGGEGEIEEKKSRFIATLRPVETEEQAFAFIEEMRKKYWNAGHHCFAFTIGENHDAVRAGDDGEPSQTAGRPMLDVLLGEDIHNACVVVTRYFGGTLLGTGGLVRAYSKAVAEGLKYSTTADKCLAEKMKIETDYTDLGKIQYILGENNIPTLSSDYSDRVVLTILVPMSKTEFLRKKLIEGTNGRCMAETTETVYYAEIAGRIQLF
ncbi:MAG: YigZ family protein [Clostridium sp.]